MLKEMDYTARVILSFFIATVIFIVIFSLASSAVHYNLDLATKGNAHITKYIAEIGASLENFSCEEDLLYEASSKLDEVGGNIGFLETKIGKSDPRVLAQKKLYSELEFRHSQMVDNFNAGCGTNFTKIFFLYSNTDGKDESEITGYILSAYKRVHPAEVMVYSFDYNLESDIINPIKSEYNITNVPAVIIRGRNFRISNINDLGGIVQGDS